jgi:hypothetical protein
MEADEMTKVDARFQWHPELREHWAGERLYFWRLHFPTYAKAEIVEQLEEVLKRVGVQAYAIYELYGGYDILLRIWLRTTHKVFEAVFHDIFQNRGIVIEGMAVNEVVTHWPWAMEDGSMRRMDEDVLKNKLANSEIARINDGLELTDENGFQAQGLIAPTWHLQGIKFIVLVGASQHAMPVAAVDRMRDRLLKIVLDADDDAIYEKSIYKGWGFCAYLILGRVRNDSFHLIEREIIRPINEILAPDTQGARTTTFPMATEDLLAFSEKMATDEEPQHLRSAAEWLELDEDQRLEVKGSAFADVKQWLNSSPPVASPPMNDVAVDSVLKAITGLLNAEGGTIVIGALESKHFKKYPQLLGLPEIGPHMVLGLQHELGDRGWDWDKHERTLHQLMETRIDGNPNPNTYVDFQSDEIDGRPVCVLTVREPRRTATSGAWFYHLPKGESHPLFWVREGNRTIQKTGNEITHYQREKTQRSTAPD